MPVGTSLSFTRKAGIVLGGGNRGCSNGCSKFTHSEKYEEFVNEIYSSIATIHRGKGPKLYKNAFMKHIGQPGVGAFALITSCWLGGYPKLVDLDPKSKQVEVDFLVKNPDEFLLCFFCMMVFSIKKNKRKCH